MFLSIIKFCGILSYIDRVKVFLVICSNLEVKSKNWKVFKLWVLNLALPKLCCCIRGGRGAWGSLV